MTELMRRRRAMMSPKAGGGLPSEYQQVEYIGISGATYLDTGLMLSGGLPLSFEFGVYRTAGGMYNSYVILAATQTGGSPWLAMSVDSNKTYVRVNNSNTLFVDAPCKNNRADCVFTFGDTETNSTVEINGQTYSGSTDTSATSLAGKRVFVNSWAGNSVFAGRVYYIRVLQQGQLVSDMIPCYRISDDAIGMYDIARRVFCAAPSNWTKGADV